MIGKYGHSGSSVADQSILGQAPSSFGAPPRMLRHRYHGVLVPNSPLRSYIIALTESQSNPDESIKESINALTEVADCAWKFKI